MRLTEKQSDVLNFIARSVEDRGFPPTRAEICDEFGFRSPNAAEDYLRALEKKGAISVAPGISRGIKIHCMN